MLLATLKISAERAMAVDASDGILSSRNLPLAATALLSILLLEIYRMRLGRGVLPLVFASALVFVVCSFYLPFRSHSRELAALPAYISLLFLLSSGLIAALYHNVGIGRVLAACILVGAAGLAAGFMDTYVERDVFKGDPAADVAVVLGGAVWGPHTPSPDLKSRLDAAAQIYREGKVKTIAVTGGTRRFNTFESEIGARYLREVGIPAANILTEHATLNTVEQIRYVKHVLIDSLKMKRAVIVSDDWHLPRAMLMCRWQGVAAKSFPSHYNLSLHWELFWRVRESAGIEVFLLFGA
jgi:vancomycin permeability regulator SanA